MLGRLIFFILTVFIFVNTGQSEASYITKKSDTTKKIKKIEKINLPNINNYAFSSKPLVIYFAPFILTNQGTLILLLRVYSTAERFQTSGNKTPLKIIKSGSYFTPRLIF